MDIYTKIFLINMIMVFATVAIDVHILDGALEASPSIFPILGLWALSTIISVPVWIVWAIVTL